LGKVLVATVTIKRLVGKTNGSGLTSWYWQPSASLRAKGWHPRALGSGGSPDAIPDEIAEQARKLNLDVDGSAGLPARELRRVQRPLTVDELIRRYQAAGFPSVRKSRQGRPVAPATQRQYRSKCRTLSAWGKGVALSSVTPERVVVLRDALMAAVDDGSEDGRVRHHAAHETLRVARTLFTWAEQQRLVPKGTNPFEDFGLAAPEPRDQIWWAPTREALLAQAAAVGVDGQPDRPCCSRSTLPSRSASARPTCCSCRFPNMSRSRTTRWTPRSMPSSPSPTPPAAAA
jgi:hypothetical protein